MPDDRPRLKKLHESLTRDGYSLPDYVTFEKDMADTNNLKKLHGTLMKDGYDLPDEVTFRTDMGYEEKKKSGNWWEKDYPVSSQVSGRSGGSGLGKIGQAAKPVTEQQSIDIALKDVKHSPAKEVDVLEATGDDFDANDPIKSVNKRIFEKTVRFEPPKSETTNQQTLSPENRIERDKGKPNDKITPHKAAEAFNQIRDQSFPTSLDARRWLFKSGKQFDEKNETDLLARDVIHEYETVKSKIDASEGDLTKAAIDYYSDKDPQLKLLKEKGIEPPENVKGDLLAKFLQDKNVKEWGNTSQDAHNVYREQADNFWQNHPEQRINKIVQQIAQAREDYGYNNPFLNLVGPKSSDNMIENLSMRGKIDDFDKDFYYKTVRPLLEFHAKQIPTTGLLENAFQSAAKGIEDVPKGVYEATGLRDLVTTQADRTYQNLQEDADAIGVKPKTFINKVTHATGNLAGVLVPISGGAKILNGFNILKSPAAANKLMMGLTFYHDLQKEAEKNNPGHPLENHLTALTQSAIFMQINNVVPKLAGNIFKDSKGAISDILNKLKNEEITGIQAKEAIVNTVVDKAIKVGGTSIKGASEMDLATGLNDVVSGIFTGKFDSDKTLQNMGHTFESMMLGMPLLNIATMRGSSRAVAGETLERISENPEQYRNEITKQAELDPEFAKQAPQLLKNLDHVEAIKKELDGREDLKPKQKQDLLITELQTKVLEDKIKNSPSKVLSGKDEKQLAEIEISKQKILDPEMSNTKLLEEFYNEELLPKGSMMMLEGENGKFNEANVGEYLKFIAQQANGFDANWKPIGEAPSMSEIPHDIIEIANKKWAKEIEAAQPKEQKTGAAVIMPGEKNNTFDVPLKKVEIDQNRELANENTPTEEIKTEIDEQPNKETITETVEPIPTEESKPTETTPDSSSSGTEPPKEEAGTGEGENINLTHAGTEKIYEEAGLPLRLETPTKHREQLEQEAEAKLQKGYDLDKVAKETMSGEHRFDDVDQVLFTRKVADLKSKQKGLDVLSTEFDKLQSEIETLSRASDVAGTIGGRFLQSRKSDLPVEETISDALMMEKGLTGSPELTAKQKETVAKEFTEISETEKALAAKMEELVAENTRLKAEAAVKNAGKSVKKGEKKDFKKEREAIFQSIKDKLEKARQDTQATILPYAKELIAIAPDVAKLMKSYIEQGVTELADIVKKIHSDIGDEKITERDVRDILAGEYNEKKQTRSELAEKSVNLRREAKLVNRLEDLMRGEIPVSEGRRQKQIKVIEDLKNQIKDIRSIDSQAKAEKEAIIDAASKRQKELAKKLDKAEKEIDTAEAKEAKEKELQEERDRKKKEAEQERERKQKLAQAEKERKQLEREFDREKKAEEKAKLKAKLDEARRIEKELSFRTPEEKRLDAYKERVNKASKEVQDKMDKGDYSIPEKKEPIKLDKEAQDLRYNLIKLKRQQETRRLLEQRKNETGKQQGMRMAAEVLNIPRTLMTIADFSGLLRQNIFFSIGHPLRTAKAIPDMFRSFVHQKTYDRWFQDYKESPIYDIAEKSKLAIADNLSHDLSKREEDFMSTLAEKIPVVGRTLRTKKGTPIIPGLNIVKGSERSYTMLLNKARVDAFTNFAEALKERGITYENSPKVYKAVAEYVNNATGRSDFGKTLNKVAPILNSAFFSPRLIASRMNMLTYFMQPRFWKTLPKEVRRDYMWNWLKLLSTGGLVLALAKAGGADVEDDPRSSDFGKIKSGNTRWDLWGGAQQYIRVLAQVASGKRKSTTTGKIYSLDGDDIFGKSRASVGLDFFRGKLAPVPAAAIDLLSGRTGIGDKIMWQWGGENGDKEVTIDQYVKERLLPMTITGTQEAMKDQGVKALFTVGVPNIFGVGTSTYKVPDKDDSARERPKPSKEKRERAKPERIEK